MPADDKRADNKSADQKETTVKVVSAKPKPVFLGTTFAERKRLAAEFAKNAK